MVLGVIARIAAGHGYSVEDIMRCQQGRHNGNAVVRREVYLELFRLGLTRAQIAHVMRRTKSVVIEALRKELQR